jgi:hypothetical protein
LNTLLRLLGHGSARLGIDDLPGTVDYALRLVLSMCARQDARHGGHAYEADQDD